jgi:hypothetical protein
MRDRKTRRALLAGLILALGLATTACRTNVGIGLSVPIGGGWRGGYGGLSMGVGIPIR